MSQISRRYLNPKVEAQMFQIFVDSFTKLGNQDKAIQFLYDLLSPVEQVMFGKRLSIAYMLLKQYPQRTISAMLKVSQPTVAKVNAALKAGTGYRDIISQLQKQERVVAFFDQLEEKIDHLLPPKGTNWSAHYQSEITRRSKQKKSF
jgi:uncharacterized protein YerC